nr:M2 family metallopeptidase [Govania unica]
MALSSCGVERSGAQAPSGPTAEEARAFVAAKSAELKGLWINAAAASWNKATNITSDTIKSEAEASATALAGGALAAREASRFNGVTTDADTRRQLEILKAGQVAPAPADPAKTRELADLMSRMEALYGEGKVCSGGKCQTLDDLSDVLATSHDEAQLRAAWVGWHDQARPLKPLYARFVALVNEGAHDLGFADTGIMWRSQYDMKPEAFATEIDRLWDEVEPLYDDLHCYVHGRLQQQYGRGTVPDGGRIPAHLLGNMWSQSWANIYPLVAPYKDAPSVDVTQALQQQGYDALKMVRMGENFFSSLGFQPLPQTFWQRSMFTRPEGREVICHASAWDLDFADDVRIKMCIKINQEDLVTIHHELGHNYYQRAYNKQPVLYQDGANDGFHEAIGDAVALSITPAYLKDKGLLPAVPHSPEAVINEQMMMALDKIAFLPFGRMIDEWRWGVFAGAITPETYNSAWWALRRKYQGIEPPVERTQADFDAGAKYHVPSNTPYMRYFLSTILQFQFYKGLCDAAGHQGPLYTCSFYDNKDAGAKLARMLEMGRSKPWPEALEVMTGTRQIDAAAMREYFAPLSAWLKEQNKGKTCGWQPS